QFIHRPEVRQRILAKFAGREIRSRGQHAGGAYHDPQPTLPAVCRLTQPSSSPLSCSLSGDPFMRWYLLPALALAALPLRHTPGPATASDKDKKEPAKPEKKGGEKPAVTVVSFTGMDLKVIDWRFTHGTRKLALSGSKPKGGDPDYLEFREDKS